MPGNSHSLLWTWAAGFKPAFLQRQPGVFGKPAEAGWREEGKQERLWVAGHHRLEAGGLGFGRFVARWQFA